MIILLTIFEALAMLLLAVALLISVIGIGFAIGEAQDEYYNSHEKD